MKKALSLLLVVFMLVPMCLITGAEEATEIRPFTAISWASDTAPYDNMTNFVTVHIGKSEDDIYPYAYMAGGRITGAKKIAAEAKKAMDTRPEGMKVLQIQRAMDAFSVKSEAVIYIDYSIEKLQKIANNFFKEYKAVGGELELLVMDVEYFAALSWYLYAWSYQKGYTSVYNDIVNHPKYQTEIRPMLVERGFKFYEGDTYPEIWSINPYSGEQYSVSRSIWDQVMRCRISAYVNKAFYEPLKEHFPEASMCDYQVSDTKGWQKKLGRTGVEIYLGGNMERVGDTSNLNSYFIAPTQEFFAPGVYKNPVAYNGAVYEDKSYNMFLWDVNRFKQSYEATDTKKFNVWMGVYNRTTWDTYAYRKGSSCNTPYYSETVLHTGMLNPDTFLYFDATEGQPDITAEEHKMQTKVFAELLNELTRVVGAADRKPIYTNAEWNNGYVLSGMYAGGKNVWRITPDTSNGMTLEEFKVEGTDPTFSSCGKTITFPQGKIIEDSKISVLGTCGYWIETPADVMPVVTVENDRYANNPSYIEDYEQYQVGSTYQYMDIKPATVWEFDITAGNARPTIVSHNGSNALALTGTTSLLNIKMPANITAGDYYAKNQAWEVTVTLPANMGSDEIIFVLGSGTADWIECDGGIKVEGSKVYYDNNGEYMPMEGVTLTAGATYTFKRVVHFENAEAFTSDFYVYDASKKEVGKIEGAAMMDLDLPVGGIKIGCENLKEQVIFDNYKLYPVGLTADFEIYQADVGIQFTETETPKNEDTAYRLSWLNGTDTNSNATVMAKFYEGGNLVSEVVLAEVTLEAFNDGVITGVVEVAEGQSVKVYMKTAAGNNVPGPGNNSGNNNSNGGNNAGNNGGINNSGVNMAKILPIALITLLLSAFGVFLAVTFIPVTGKPAEKNKK